MKKIILFICLLYLPLAVAQNQYKIDTLDYIPAKYQPIYGFGNIDEYLQQEKIKEIIYQRTTCFGDCPSYEVTFYKSGKAEYIGYYFVKMKGKFKGNIDKYIFARLTYLLEKDSILNLNDDYSSRISDASAAILTIEFENKKLKSIRNYNNYGPIELWGIDKVIEAVTKEINWSKKSQK